MLVGGISYIIYFLYVLSLFQIGRVDSEISQKFRILNTYNYQESIEYPNLGTSVNWADTLRSNRFICTQQYYIRGRLETE